MNRRIKDILIKYFFIREILQFLRFDIKRIVIKYLYIREILQFIRFDIPKILEITFIPLIEKEIIFSLPGFIFYKFLSRKLSKKRLSIKSFKAQRGKIIFVAPSLGPGGSERQMVNLLCALKGEKVNVSLLVENSYMIKGYDYFRPTLDIKKVPIANLEKNDALNSKKYKWSKNINLSDLKWCMYDYQTTYVQAYIDFFMKHKPQVLHTWLDPINMAAGLAAYLCGVPKIILSCRSVNPSHFGFYRPPMRSIYRLLIKDPSVTMLNNSDAGAKDYARWLGVKKNNIHIIRNGFDSANYLKGIKKINNKSKTHVIGTIFRLTEEKQPLLWIKMAKALLDRNIKVRFSVVASGPMMKEFKELLKLYGIEKYFSIKSQPKNVAHYLKKMDIFVLTSRKEGSPNVLLEAQALGIPVISTDAGGAKETFINGITGLLSKKGTVRELADKVCDILNGKISQKEVSFLGPRFIQEKFGLDRFVNEHKALYNLKENK